MKNLISTRGKKTTSIIIYGSYKTSTSYKYENRPWEAWSGQTETIAAIKSIKEQIKEEIKEDILKELDRKRWTKSLDAYLLNELRYNDNYKYLENVTHDLLNGEKYKEYIKNNIIHYINIY